MTDKDAGSITGYHAHVYFDARTREEARVIREAVEARFPVVMGRWHEKPVGPHPCWSYQIAFRPEVLNEILPWLALNRRGLTVFVHPESGDDLADHRDHAIWLGPSETLDLSIFG